MSRKMLGKFEAEEGLDGVEVVVEEEMDWAWNATVGR